MSQAPDASTDAPATTTPPLGGAAEAVLTTSASSKPEGFWTLVREAVRGSHRDFTSESLGRAILLLAVPMVLEMIMESVFAVVDIFWVAKLGADSVATVGLTESMLTLIYAVAMGLSMGAAAVVARRTGEKDHDGAARAAVQAVVLGVALSSVVAAIGLWKAPELLALIGAAPSTIEVGTNYTRVMLGGNVTIVLLFLINAVFRGAGDAAIAMRTLWLANLINIALGPFLVFGWGPFPELGVTGAAVATTIGRGTGVLYQLYALARARGRLQVLRRHLQIEAVALASIVRISGSGIVQILIATTSWVGLMKVLSSFGSPVVAGYTIAVRVVMFALLPSFGMANAAATLVGQNLGARRPERSEQAVWRAARYNLYFLGSVGLIFVLFAGSIVGIFTREPAVHAEGTHALRIVAAGFPFYAYGMVVGQSFNGAGDTRTPTFINLGCFWVFEIPLAYLLARVLKVGPQGVYLAIALAFTLSAVISVLLFRRGRWKGIKV